MAGEVSLSGQWAGRLEKVDSGSVCLWVGGG